MRRPKMVAFWTTFGVEKVVISARKLSFVGEDDVIDVDGLAVRKDRQNVMSAVSASVQTHAEERRQRVSLHAYIRAARHGPHNGHHGCRGRDSHGWALSLHVAEMNTMP